MVTHKNSKFLFYNFNNYLNSIGTPVQFVKQTLISNNDYAFYNFARKKYFIERILQVSQSGSLQLEDLDRAIDIEKKKKN